MGRQTSVHKARIKKARRVMEIYFEDDDEMECCIVDAITDLLHLARLEGIDAEAVLRMASNHFEAEKKHIKIGKRP